MKLLLDQGLPRSTAGWLRNAGIEAVHVGELDMAAASDEAIIEYAHSHFFAIVTLDSDFHALLAVRNANKPSVIRLRVQRLRSPEAGVADFDSAPACRTRNSAWKFRHRHK